MWDLEFGQKFCTFSTPILSYFKVDKGVEDPKRNTTKCDMG